MPATVKTLETYFARFDGDELDRQRAALAKKVGVSPGYLYLIERGHKKPAPKLAIKLETETGLAGFKVRKQVLRPDIFAATPA